MNTSAANKRCKAANCSALFLTLDLQVIGQRHKDLKNGLTSPPKPTIPNLINIATKPRWALNMLRMTAMLRRMMTVDGDEDEEAQAAADDENTPNRITIMASSLYDYDYADAYA